jgi:vacuolar-type H+-ATPase subunit E/Vma4
MRRKPKVPASKLPHQGEWTRFARTSRRGGLASWGTAGAAAGEAAPVASSEFVERIAAILDGAEASAERIRSEARNEAAQVLREAHARAAQRAVELTAEPERIRDEVARAAAETRAQADEYATETRAAADAEAGQILASAQAEADALRQAAQDEVRRMVDEGRRQQDELAAQVRDLARMREGAIEDVRAVIAGMRSAADQLERDGVGASTTAETPSDDLQARAKKLGIDRHSEMTREQPEDAIRVVQTPNREPL